MKINIPGNGGKMNCHALFNSDNGPTIREEFAARIFAGILASGEVYANEKNSRYAVYCADVLISALNMDPQEIHNEFNSQTNEQ